MSNFANPVRPGKDVMRTVAQHGIVRPTSFPQLADHLHVFVGDLVAAIMGRLFVKPLSFATLSR